MLVSRFTVLTDFRRANVGYAFDELMFFMTAMPLIYVYGKINHTIRCTDKKTEYVAHKWRGVRYQKYFVRMPLPIVLAANIEKHYPRWTHGYNWPLPRRSVHEIIADEGFRRTCIEGTRTTGMGQRKPRGRGD
jgi:hypothetical protein